MHVNVDTDKIEIDVPEADEWVERIGKTAYEMCNNDHIKLKTLETGRRTGFIIESNDSELHRLGLSINILIKYHFN